MTGLYIILKKNYTRYRSDKWKDAFNFEDNPVFNSVALSCCVGASCLGPVGWRHMYEMVTEHFDNPNLTVVVATVCVVGLWRETEPLCVQSLSQP